MTFSWKRSDIRSIDPRPLGFGSLAIYRGSSLPLSSLLLSLLVLVIILCGL